VWSKLTGSSQTSPGLFGIANLHRPGDFLAAAKASVQRSVDVVIQLGCFVIVVCTRQV
jgi:hypothetical protein